MNPQPKPVRREKKRKPLRRGKPLWPATYEEAREQLRARARRPKRKTKHARRDREWGRMAFAHKWPCDVTAAFIAEFEDASVEAILLLGPCRGSRQYMHLHLEDDGGVRPPDHQGAIGCEGHHDDIDGRSGRRARAWYVALGDDGQLRLKRRLVDRQRGRWDLLGNEGQAAQDRRALEARPLRW